MSVKLVRVIKELVRDSIDISKFSDITYGEVVGVDPLQIKLNDKITLEIENLILTNAVKDHEIDVTVSWNTEEFDVDPNGGHSHDFIDKGMFNITSPAKTNPATIGKPNHKHEIKDKKKMIVHNKLKVGEKVVLIKAYGGQSYVVLDRLSKYECEGEWNDNSSSNTSSNNASSGNATSSSNGASSGTNSSGASESTDTKSETPSKEDNKKEQEQAKEEVRVIVNEELEKFKEDFKVDIRAIIQEELKKGDK